MSLYCKSTRTDCRYDTDSRLEYVANRRCMAVVSSCREVSGSFHQRAQPVPKDESTTEISKYLMLDMLYRRCVVDMLHAACCAKLKGRRTVCCIMYKCDTMTAKTFL